MKQMVPHNNPPRIAEHEFLTDLGNGNFIFIGSSTDMFAEDIPSQWITRVLDYCKLQHDVGNKNAFLLQSKNPQRFLEFVDHPIAKRCVFGTTIESNRFYPGIMCNAPQIEERVEAMEKMANLGFTTMVTAEPLLSFDLEQMLEYIKRCNPKKVNIGRNSYRNIELPEPSKEGVKLLIEGLKGISKIEIKKNAKLWMA
jgi:DNA repair photolyase